MRGTIARRMHDSLTQMAQLTLFMDADLDAVVADREQRKAAGTAPSYTDYVIAAAGRALVRHPVVISQVTDDGVALLPSVHVGMAVALDWGLIVPVIRNAETLTLAEIAVKANDLADRARTKKLSPDEVQGGTFTITNPGVFGGLYGTPIINQPQVAILCVGTIEKRAKVMTSPDGDDYIAIRQMAYFALTYDHRVVDGADAEKFLAYLKGYLESAPFTI